MAVGAVAKASSLFGKAGKALKSKAGLGSVLSIGLTSIFAIPELQKISEASKAGKTLKQTGGSIINFGKWFAVPAAIVALVNPLGIASIAGCAIAGFVAPSLIPDIDYTKKKGEYIA